MRFPNGVTAILAFGRIQTTILLVIIYATVFISVLLTDKLPSIPKDTRGLDVEQAWLDLHQVSARPHTFNSHANDIVRQYILDRVTQVASRYPHVEISDDTLSNASWASGPVGWYLQGNNILVKVDGTDPQYPESGGVLLSAHFDSVATAPGVTDDGMGVVTLMQMVEYFAKHRPKRTVVFNLNNAEENGLLGAHTFLEHEWAKIPDVFVNLEGAAAGGRPLLFRATSTIPLRSWTSSFAPHPHANVLMADIFSRGVLRSDTDYSVYTKAGLEGVDFAFYRGRSRYHTKYDSIPGIQGGKRSLWAMMENAHGASIALANRDDFHGKPAGPVYFDLFGAALVLFSFQTLFILDVVLLTVGPIILLLLVFSEGIVKAAKGIRRRPLQGMNGGVAVASLGARTLAVLKNIGMGFWRSANFWLAILVSVALQAILVASYVKFNPFTIHSHPYLVFVSALSLAYLSVVWTLSIPLIRGAVVLTPQQRKLQIFLQLYIFTWLALVVSTEMLRKCEIGSTYLFMFWNAAAFLGSALACAEGMLGSQGSAERNGYEAVSTEEAGEEQVLSSSHDRDPTETTPLIQREGNVSRRPDEKQGIPGYWILQLLVAVPFPVILFVHDAIALLEAMHQTLTDGNSPTSVYVLTSIFALLIILPMAPFATSVHRSLTNTILVVFILSTLYTWFAFPFSQQDPFKVYFAQTVDLDLSGTSVEHVATTLTGAKQFLQSHILPVLPSAYRAPVVCYDSSDQPGLETCKWEVGEVMWPSPGGKEHENAPWVKSSSVRTGDYSARLKVRGRNTRGCYLEFSNRRISRFEVVGDGRKGLQEGFQIPEGGLSSIQLWTRDFGKDLMVDVEWEDDDLISAPDAPMVRVSCGWTEYESATVGGGASGGAIPSVEEAIKFLPEWAAVTTKYLPPLVDAGFWFKI